MVIRFDLVVHRNELPGIIRRLPAVERKRRKKIAEFAASRARAYAAVDTGAMQASTQAFDDGRGVGVESYGGRDGRAYARFVEFGTRKNRAQPFIRPGAVDAIANLPALFAGFDRELVG